MEQAKEEKAIQESLNFLINLIYIAILAKDKVTMDKELQTFQESWNHPDDESQKKWREAIKKKMIKQQVLDKTIMNHLPLIVGV